MPTSEEVNVDEGQPDVAKRPLADKAVAHEAVPPERPLADKAVADEAVPDEPVPCHLCKLWLNGPDQYKDHLLRSRHRTNIRRQLRKERSDSFFGSGHETA